MTKHPKLELILNFTLGLYPLEGIVLRQIHNIYVVKTVDCRLVYDL